MGGLLTICVRARWNNVKHVHPWPNGTRLGLDQLSSATTITKSKRQEKEIDQKRQPVQLTLFLHSLFVRGPRSLALLMQVRSPPVAKAPGVQS